MSKRRSLLEVHAELNDTKRDLRKAVDSGKVLSQRVAERDARIAVLVAKLEAYERTADAMTQMAKLLSEARKP